MYIIDVCNAIQKPVSASLDTYTRENMEYIENTYLCFSILICASFYQPVPPGDWTGAYVFILPGQGRQCHTRRIVEYDESSHRMPFDRPVNLDSLTPRYGNYYYLWRNLKAIDLLSRQRSLPWGSNTFPVIFPNLTLSLLWTWFTPEPLTFGERLTRSISLVKAGMR